MAIHPNVAAALPKLHLHITEDRTIVFNIIISLLPPVVTFLLGIGQALLTGSSNEWIESFELTQAQIEQIKQIEREYESSLNKFAEEIRSNELLLTQSIIGTGTIEELRQQESSLEAIKIQAAQVYFDKFLAIRSVLTPPQIFKQCENFALTKEQMMAKFMRENTEQD